MLSLDFIKNNPDKVEEAARLKGVAVSVPTILDLERQRVAIQRTANDLAFEQGGVSKSVQQAKDADRPALIQRARELRGQIDGLRAEQAEIEARLREHLLRVPNIPSPLAPVGGAEANRVVRTWGEIPANTPRDHVELMDLNGWGDLQRIAALSGARSYMLRGQLALLELALHRFAMDFVVERGFEPLTVPSMARPAAFVASGHFPDAEQDTYFVGDDTYLAGTAEVILNSLHSGEILAVDTLPRRYAGYSPCFRKESGSAGRDVRGLMRVHQFAKTEQYVLCEADADISEALHAEILDNAEQILQRLELPYRVVECATGDMGLGKYRMHDIECWVPSQSQYRETHSCSSLTDWQARRSNLRYRDANGDVHFAYTLNNTALATPRVLVMLLENHQLEDGSVYVPVALRPYLGGRERLTRS